MLGARRGIRDSGWQSIVRKPLADSVFHAPGIKLDATTLHDYSGNNNHGTITGTTPTRLPSGLVVLNFDGADDSVALTDNMAESDFWVHFWMKSTDSSTAILSTYDAANPYWHIRLLAADNVIHFYGIDTTGGSVESHWEGTAAVKDGAWHSIDVVFDLDTDLYIYTDGVEGSTLIVGSIASIDGTLHNSKAVNIGKHPGVASWWEGSVALLAWSNIAPSANTITQRRNQERYLFRV